MKVRSRLQILTILMGTLIVACGADTNGDAGGTSMPEEITTSTAEQGGETTVPGTRNPPDRVPSTTTAPPVTGEVPDEILTEILADAARRAGADLDHLEVMRSEFVEWPDGSLGCPEPGQVYVQVIVPGYWVEIDGPDGVLDYRVSDSGNFRLCETETPARGSLGTTPTTMGSDSS